MPDEKIKSYQKVKKLLNDNTKEVTFKFKFSFILKYIALGVLGVVLLTFLLFYFIDFRSHEPNVFAYIFTFVIFLNFAYYGRLAILYKYNKSILNRNFIIQNGVIIYWKNVKEIFLIKRNSKRTVLIIQGESQNIKIRTTQLNYGFDKTLDYIIGYWSAKPSSSSS